jgi:transcriptional regulator with XRE-family HTH domain
MEILNSIGERLREERERMQKTQSEIAGIAVAADVPGATRQSQAKYEKGLAAPSATYLAAIAAAGADVLYILTGKRVGPAPLILNDDEKGLLADYREASGPVRRAARAALQSGASPPGGIRNQTINAPVVGNVSGGSVSISNKVKNNR